MFKCYKIYSTDNKRKNKNIFKGIMESEIVLFLD